MLSLALCLVAGCRWLLPFGSGGVDAPARQDQRGLDQSLDGRRDQRGPDQLPDGGPWFPCQGTACPEGYTCFASQVCPKGGSCGPQLGDLMCHKTCIVSGDCVTGTSCQDADIWSGDTVTTARLCM